MLLTFLWVGIGHWLLFLILCFIDEVAIPQGQSHVCVAACLETGQGGGKLTDPCGHEIQAVNLWPGLRYTLPSISLNEQGALVKSRASPWVTEPAERVHPNAAQTRSWRSSPRRGANWKRDFICWDDKQQKFWGPAIFQQYCCQWA